MAVDSLRDPAPGPETATGPIAVRFTGVSKDFRVPTDRPETLKQRVLHPRASRAGTTLHALRDLSFEVPRGEFLGVVGRNGSGKSTLLKCAAGIYEPTSGKVEVAGRISPFLELGIGFNPEFAARDNVELACSLIGVPPKVTRQRFGRIIEFAELEDFVDLKHKNYSTGMAMRLAFATAINVDADILLIDEALAVGDEAFKEKCYGEFWRMKDEGQTILFVTHAMGLVKKFCDRAFLLDEGEIIEAGSPADAIEAYHLRSRARADEQAKPKPRPVAVPRPPEPPPPAAPPRAPEAPPTPGLGTVSEVWIENAAGERQAAFQQGDEATLHVRVSFPEETEEPVLGVVVTDERGESVVVRDSVRDDLRRDATAGGEALYTVKFYVYTGTGHYTATLAIGSEEAARLGFRVSGERRDPTP